MSATRIPTVTVSLDLPPFVPIHSAKGEVSAASLLGISKNSAYAAAERGEIPTISIGSRRIVPVGRLLEMAGFEVEAV